jgi:hypothetical protein|tara:strand:- start:4192 stop:4572 length:381 start_codon:yes stop_codon:yes gene_type:complete
VHEGRVWKGLLQIAGGGVSRLSSFNNHTTNQPKEKTMRKAFKTFVVATALTASAFAVSAQEQTTSETGEMMQNEGAMQGGMMDGDMMDMMKMMTEMKPMMEACTEMMASMTENMDGGMMPSPNSDG